jgi:3-deoxy-manno-octulosonate cytidylyltransferase (CMP-KDO synthetase)
MKFIAIIPARYQSTRFPGKPLSMLGDKPLIRWVYENVSLAVEHTWVATDDNRIYDAVEAFGGKAIKTFSGHRSGTDRCAEAALKLEQVVDFDVVINVQGDEPFVTEEQIKLLQSCFDNDTEIATLVKEIDSADELFNPNRPKVVLDAWQNALYFSRSAIPFVREAPESNWLSYNRFWAHIGMYGFRKNTLQEITKLEPGILEQIESLEQLRWLEHGYRIKTAVTVYQSMGIDTPDDLRTATDYLMK